MGDTIPLRLEKDSAFEEGSAHWPMWAIHLEGAMGASQTVLPFKLAASDESGGFRERESVQ